MTDFPELQHALVDAARERYGRRRRLPRLALRLVPVAAACAVIAAVVLVVANGAGDPEQPAPPAGAPAEQLERAFAIFRRPARPADALPLEGKQLERFASGRGRAQMDVGRARLAYDEGARRLYLIPAEIDGRAAVCASLFRGAREVSWHCGPFGSDGVVATVIPARFGEPNTVLGAAADGVKEIFAFAEGNFGWEVRNNGVLLRVDRYPTRLWWTDPTGRERSIGVAAPSTKELPEAGGRCPTLSPLPADAEAKAGRLALSMARSQYPEFTARIADVSPAHGFVAGCGPVVAERTITVTVALESDSGRNSARYGFGQVDGEMTSWFEQGF
jgi:hypothetical protein